MNLTLTTYNGSTISGYSAKIIEHTIVSEANPISVERVNEVPAYGGKSFRPSKFKMGFTLATATRQTDMENIGKIFDPRTNNLGILRAQDTNDSNAAYHIHCTPLDIPRLEGNYMEVTMWAADPVWQKIDSTYGTVTIAAPGTASGTLTNNGNVDAYPTITITPTTTAGTYTYRQHIIAYNPTTYPLRNYPIDVTSGGINTAALVAGTANSCQIAGTISAAATAIPYDTVVGSVASSGYGYVDTEQIRWAGKTGTTSGTLTGVLRGRNGTTAASHADNAVIYKSILQANGDDVGVLIGNVPQERWFGGTVASGTAVKVWSVFNFAAKAEGSLRIALAASGETTISYKNTTANIAALSRMPSSGMVLIDSEVIAYTDLNIRKRTLTIEDDNSRGVKDTTAATHAIGATIRWIQHNIILEYCSLATEIDQTDRRKPCFSLANSTNTNWRYDSADSVFADEKGLRAGAWKPAKPAGNHSDWYGGNQGTVGTDPVTNMGAEIVSYQVGSLYKAERARIWWTFQNNAGITSISSLGEKYRLATTTPWPTTRLLSSIDGRSWTQEWTEAAPGTAATWQSWTNASETVPSGTRFLRFEFFGAVNAVSGATARNEVNLGASGSMGVSLESTGVPQITVGAQTSNADINTTITNSTTGDSFVYAYPCKQNATISIDTEDRRVKYRGHLLAPPELSSVRQEWLRLAPGANVITYADDTAGAVTVVFTWQQRKNV